MRVEWRSLTLRLSALFRSDMIGRSLSNRHYLRAALLIAMLQNSHRDDDHHNGLLPVTVVAVRRSDRPGWRLIPLKCELDFLPHLLTKFGLDGVEFRLVGNGRTGRGLEERFAVRSALSGRWDWDKEADGWFPLDEPLPTLLPGEAVATAVVLSLKSVLFGCIEIVVEAGDKSLTMWLDDVHDSPVSLVRFIQVLLLLCRVPNRQK